jgi:hypothetical protein
MIKKLYILILAIMAVHITGCIRETYDMDKLSGGIHIAPTWFIPAVKGVVSFSDLVEPSDTVVYDENNFVRLIFKQDSIINLKLDDFYDLADMVSFHQSYEIGELSIGSFQGTLSMTLNQITQNMAATVRNQIQALDDGAAHLFPSFPSVNLGERTFSAFQNFDNAIFQSGFLDISVTNNLNTPLTSININLFNTSGHTAIGTVTIPPVQPGQTQTSSVNLTNKRVTSSVLAGIVLSGSPGTSNPVMIKLNNSNITVTAMGRDLKVYSGRVVIPSQEITTLDNRDTVSFDPGDGVELDEIRIISGNLSYTLTSETALAASLSMALPTMIRNIDTVTYTITSGTENQLTGTIDVSGTITDLGSDPVHPFNRIPLDYSIIVGSNGILVDHNSTDKVEIDLSLDDTDFDYVKGYFGEESETIEPDTLDLDIDDILDHITGKFLLSNPSIRLNYSNSFALPLALDLQASGKRGSETVNLGLDPVTIVSPQYPASRDAVSTLLIDKNNSDLPELISLPPGKVIFFGSASMNPDGKPGLRDNYVFGNSRFLGAVEVEVPMEFRMNNLQFTDTIDNFLRSDEEDDSPVKPENIKSLELSLTATNYFPLGVSVKMSLYDEKTNSVKSTIDATTLIEAAPVDASGKSSGFKETTTKLDLNGDFFEEINNADKMIIWFTLNTTSSGAVDVKIYSDYRIDFKTALIFKPEITFD